VRQAVSGISEYLRSSIYTCLKIGWPHSQKYIILDEIHRRRLAATLTGRVSQAGISRKVKQYFLGFYAAWV
jgi:hypothetical protein